ncbi:MAG: nucleotidyltransferase domain-containing protein [Dehalococcoidales bacterium]|nr:MAG: nucleotidyltransferase domain-containing protein [Dehalococcoidales bacterium]
MSIKPKFDEELKDLLPKTYSLLASSGLEIHERVMSIVLHGSRGLKGNARPDSDLDLSLITDITGIPNDDLGNVLDDVTRIALDSWQGSVHLDLAVVFDTADCGLKCFYISEWDDRLCDRGTDCFGIYRIQNGLNGFVTNASVHVEKMYPCMVVWRKDSGG